MCLKAGILNQSHIVPSFVGRWLKETSVTGYLRQFDNPNLRKQDIVKKKLLCSVCEMLLSSSETKFAENIFYPYVGSELDDWGVAQGKIEVIEYDNWLLKFVIGLQWRALITHPVLSKEDSSTAKFNEIIDTALSNWSDFLLEKRANSGDERHYIIFLQNLAPGVGNLPQNISEWVNTYLLRSVDTTLALSAKNLFLFTKLGPIVIISGLIPQKIKRMNDALIRYKGRLRTAQNLGNSFINDFIFITRPNEAVSKYIVSEVQDQKIAEDIERKVKSSKNLHSLKAAYSDKIIRARLKGF